MGRERGWVVALQFVIFLLGTASLLHASAAKHVQIITPRNGEVIHALPVSLHYHTLDDVSQLDIYLDDVFKGSHGSLPHGQRVLSFWGREGEREEHGEFLKSGTHTFRIDAGVSSDEIVFNLSLPSLHQPIGEAAFGISIVLLIGDFRQKGLSSRSEPFARALEEAGVGVLRLQEDEVSKEHVQFTLHVHRPELVIYHPWLGLVDILNKPQDMDTVWRVCLELSIPTLTFLSDIHSGIRIDPSDPVWLAQYVASPDGGGRIASALKNAEIVAYHLWVGSAMAALKPTLDEIEQQRMQREEEETGTGKRAWLYDVLIVGAHWRQEHLECCPFDAQAGEADGGERGEQKQSHALTGGCMGPGWGLRSRVARQLEKRTDRVRFELTALKDKGLRELLAVSKVTVVIGACAVVPPAGTGCPSAGFWGAEVYEIVGNGGFVVHEAVEALENHLTNGSHIAMFDPGNMASLDSVIDYYLEHEDERERIRRDGQQHVMQHHTITARMRDLLTKVTAVEAKLNAGVDVEDEASLLGLGRVKAGTDQCSDPKSCENPAPIDRLSSLNSGGGRSVEGGSDGAMEGGEEVMLDELLREHGVYGVVVAVLNRTELSEEQRTIKASLSLPEEEHLFAAAGRSHYIKPQIYSRKGLLLLRVDEVTITAGLVLCNATHVITAFGMHGQDFQTQHPPGCFRNSFFDSRSVVVEHAILVPIRWGNSWQHFVQDTIFLLEYALEVVPQTVRQRASIILETKLTRNNIAILAALLGPAAMSRILFVDHECNTGALIDLRRRGQFQCSTYIHARQLYIPTSYPQVRHLGFPEPGYLRKAQKRIAGYVSGLLAFVSARQGVSRAATSNTRPGALAAGAGAWLWECRHTKFEPFHDCAWNRPGGMDMATSPLLVLSRGNSSTCCDRALDRCLLNEAELVQDLSALHAAIVASAWHARESPHPLELQPGQHRPVQVMPGEERTLLETAMLVAAAEVIVAAHGGQCFNLIFARPGAVFVEILPGQRSMDGPHSVRSFAQGLGLQMWITVVPGVAHRAYASVAPFRVDPSRVIAIVLHTFAIRAAEIASVSVQPELIRTRGAAQSNPDAGEPVEYAIYFVGSFLDQLVRGRDCDLEGFCLSVRVIVDGNPAGDYRIAKTAGVTVNGFVSARLRPGVHQVQALLVDVFEQSLGIASDSILFDTAKYWAGAYETADPSASDEDEESALEDRIPPGRNHDGDQQEAPASIAPDWTQSPEPALRWVSPLDGEVFPDESELHLEVEPTDTMQALAGVCFAQQNIIDFHARQSRYPRANDWVHSRCSVRMDIDGQEVWRGPCKLECSQVGNTGPRAEDCWTSCFVPAATKGLRVGVRVLSVALIDPSNSSVAPVSSVSIMMGEESPQKFRQRLAEYAAVHKRARASTRICGEHDTPAEWEAGQCLRALVYSCVSESQLCGGFTDRIKGIVSSFLLAMYTNRTFFIQHRRPRRLEAFLAPGEIDWTLEGVAALDQASVEFDEQEFLDPESFPRLLTFVASKLSGRTGPPLVKVTMNFNVGPSLAKVEMFDDFVADFGLRHLYPSPASFVFSYLFRDSESLKELLSEELSFLDFPSDVTAAILQPRTERSSPFFNGRDATSREAVIGLQLRGGVGGWNDPAMVRTEHEVALAMGCVAATMAGLGAAASEAFVLVTSDSSELLTLAFDIAPSVGIDSGRMRSVRPPMVAHLDRSDKVKAAAAMKWVVVENLLLSRADALVVSSGFGATAGDYGGLHPSLVSHFRTCTPFIHPHYLGQLESVP